MKKLLVLAPVAALALAACSSDAIVEQSSSETYAAKNGDLVIRPSVGANSRGTAINSASELTGFAVAISGNFQQGNEYAETPENENVKTSFIETLSGSGTTWTFSNSNRYWWNDKTTEGKFTAMYPAAKLTEAVVTAKKLASFSPETTVANQVDLMTAFNSGLRDDFTNGVDLQFKHALSQIDVNAVNADNGSVQIEVAGMRIKNVKSIGNLILPTATADATWEENSVITPVNYTVGANTATPATTDVSIITSSNSIMKGAPMLLIPQDLSGNDASISVLVRISDVSKYVPYVDNDGKLYTGGEDGLTKGTGIDFNGKLDNDGKLVLSTDNPTRYVGSVTESETTTQLIYEENGLWYFKASKDAQAQILYMCHEVLYPREGHGNCSPKFAYVKASIATEWLQGYKYAYTLNFGVNAYGATEAYADQGLTVSDQSTTKYPLGDEIWSFDGTNIEPLEPDEPIVDNPVELKFIDVTVSSWENGTTETPNM